MSCSRINSTLLNFTKQIRRLTTSRFLTAGIDSSSIAAGPQSSSAVDKYTKSARIQSSIKLYLKRIQDYESLLASEQADFDRGRKYLARIMGEDPATFDQDKIDESIRYLFPSNLFCLKARPKLKPPDEVFPRKKEMQCDSTGRPLHDMFYTRFPNYYAILHEATYELERLKQEIDNVNILRSVDPFTNYTPIDLVSTEWFTKEKLTLQIDERISDDQYDRWLVLMNRLVEHPLSNLAHQFIFQYRFQPNMDVLQEDYPEPQVDPVTKQRFVETYGQKRWSLAQVTVSIPGSGKFRVNDQGLLLAFPNLGDREQIMYPLQLTKSLGKVDVVATTSGEGTSSPANAVRLAISRALACLLPDERVKLKVSGLLTQDERSAERKKPGQKKARKKPIWKAR